MRKGIAEGRSGTIAFNQKSLDNLESRGFKFVLVKGFTTDNHYEHVDPHCLVLVPLKELPTDPAKKDIYAPIGSKILHQWAKEKDSTIEILIANNLYH